MRTRVVVAIGLVVGAACGSDTTVGDADRADSTTAATDADAPDAPSPPESGGDSGGGPTVDDSGVDSEGDPALAAVIDIADAIAINLATNGMSEPVVAWTEREAVRLARIDLGSFTLRTPVDVSGELVPIAHPIERPAVSVGPDDVVHAAFTSFVESNGTVHYVDLAGDEPNAPIHISGEPQPETNLVHMTEADDAPTLAWLEDSTLSVAPHRGGRPTEIERVDDLTCDCCNPVPIQLDDRLLVAYRNLERSDAGVIRDVYVTTTDDEAATFAEPVLVADDHWFLDGCPFSGPAVAEVDDTMIVAWMDGRQSLHPDQDATTIWVDRSSDRGTSFGTDLAITDGGIHRWPVLAVDRNDTIHLVWETQAVDGGIAYSRSDDGGVGFTPPTMLIPNTTESGLRRAPSVIVHEDRLVVSWVDRIGGHVAQFDIARLPH